MKNNFFATVMLGGIGLLLLVAAFQMAGIGTGVKELTAEPFEAETLNQLTEDAAPQKIDPKVYEQKVDEIVAAPLFSSTRSPYIPPPEVVGDLEEEKPASPLDAKVTSIVITGDNSYVMIQDNVSKQRVTLTQGMPLEGDQGLWTVASIEPRKVLFEAEGMEPVELELEVFSGSLGGGQGNKNNKKKRNKNNRNNNQTIKEVEKDKDGRKNSAEEIRKKIAERRAEMRKKAAERNQKTQ